MHVYSPPKKATTLTNLDFFQIKISPTFWTLIKMKITSLDSLILSKSHGITFIFMNGTKKSKFLCVVAFLAVSRPIHVEDNDI